MVVFTSLLLTAIAATGAFAAPSGELATRQSTPNSSGNHGGFFYSWWSDGGASATYTNLSGGGYEVRWGNGGNLVGGKGWKPGLRAR
jgi:endo-1,4-beta-xylanase